MTVISKIDIPNKLTKGKSYLVNSEIQDLRLETLIIIYDDSSELTWYYKKSFLSLQEHRELNIDKILEDDKQF